ncbi:MAG: hypothetical protein ACAI44_13770 [Candidatus Sericytochromatia bacterium]
MKPYLALLILLSACSQPPAPTASGFAGAPGFSRVVTAPKANPAPDIDLMTRILPGSKGDRNTLAQLEVQLLLPDFEAFSQGSLVLALTDAQLAGQWVAVVDGQPVKTRLVASTATGGERTLSFVLEDVNLGNTEFQEILLRSPDQGIQAAALVPALQAGQSRLAEPLSLLSTAVWLLASEDQADRGESPQHLSTDEFRQLQARPDATVLAGSLKKLFLDGKGQLAPETFSHNASARPHTPDLAEPANTSDSGHAGSRRKRKVDDSSPANEPGRKNGQADSQASGNESQNILAQAELGAAEPAGFEAKPEHGQSEEHQSEHDQADREPPGQSAEHQVEHEQASQPTEHQADHEPPAQAAEHQADHEPAGPPAESQPDHEPPGNSAQHQPDHDQPGPPAEPPAAQENEAQASDAEAEAPANQPDAAESGNTAPAEPPAGNSDSPGNSDNADKHPDAGPAHGSGSDVQSPEPPASAAPGNSGKKSK